MLMKLQIEEFPVTSYGIKQKSVLLGVLVLLEIHQREPW